VPVTVNPPARSFGSLTAVAVKPWAIKHRRTGQSRRSRERPTAWNRGRADHDRSLPRWSSELDTRCRLPSETGCQVLDSYLPQAPWAGIAHKMPAFTMNIPSVHEILVLTTRARGVQQSPVATVFPPPRLQTKINFVLVNLLVNDPGWRRSHTYADAPLATQTCTDDTVRRSLTPKRSIAHNVGATTDPRRTPTTPLASSFWAPVSHVVRCSWNATIGSACDLGSPSRCIAAEL